MTGFHADWLALREPYDHAARDGGLAARLSDVLANEACAHILDLGCGTGSNLRYLAPRLTCPQAWCLVDDDPALLERLAHSDGFDSQCHQILRRNLTEPDAVAFEGCHAVVASALMDLVSQAWFGGLAHQCWQAGAAILVALDYNGRMQWHPDVPDDDWIETNFNAHQRGDKGFGPAMGPVAAAVMPEMLRDLGYAVTTARTPWDLGPQDHTMQTELLDGIAAACLEKSPDAQDRIAAWSSRRGEMIGDRRSRLQVGHGDLLALPPGMRA